MMSTVGLLYKREMRNLPTLNDVHSVRPTCTMSTVSVPLALFTSVRDHLPEQYQGTQWSNLLHCFLNHCFGEKYKILRKFMTEQELRGRVKHRCLVCRRQ